MSNVSLSKISASLAASLLSVAVLASPVGGGAHAAEPLRIASWNVKHLGWDEADKDLRSIARVIGAFDFVSLQEVMDEDVVEDILRHVETVTQEDWSQMTSHAIGRGRYKEAYTFMWRNDRVAFLEGAVVYVDSRDAFAREPFSARFEVDGGVWTFAAAGLHAIYGDRKAQREAEARALPAYWSWLADTVYPDEPNIMLMGDFNLEPDDAALRPLARFAQPLTVEADSRTGGTTLSPRDDRYANFYDHIWLDRRSDIVVQAADVLPFPDLLDMTHEVARETVSDHAPVYMLATP